MGTDATTFAAVSLFVVLCGAGLWAVRRPLFRRQGIQPVGALALRRARPRANELILGSPERPALTIRLSDESKRWRREPTRIPPQTRAFLEPLLQQVPQILFDGAAMGSSLHRVVLQFDPKTAKALASKTLELTPTGKSAGSFRAIARDASTKRMVDHGTLFVGTSPAAIAAALWNLAAIVTAQKFAADIKASLENLERSIEDIYQFLVDQELGQLEGNLSWLRDRAEWLRSSEVTPAEVALVASELERVDRELRGTGHTILSHMLHLEEALGGIDFGRAWFDAEPAAEAACLQLGRLRSASLGLLMVAEAAVLNATIRGGLDVGRAFASKLLDWTEKQLDEHRAVWARVGESMDFRLPQLKAAFQSSRTGERIQSSVGKVLADSRSRADSLQIEISAQIGYLRKDGEASSVPLLFEFQINAAGWLGEAHQLFPG